MPHEYHSRAQKADSAHDLGRNTRGICLDALGKQCKVKKKPYLETMVISAAPNATIRCVRTPASFRRALRSKPITSPHSLGQKKIRSRHSQKSVAGIFPVKDNPFSSSHRRKGSRCPAHAGNGSLVYLPAAGTSTDEPFSPVEQDAAYLSRLQSQQQSIPVRRTPGASPSGAFTVQAPSAAVPCTVSMQGHAGVIGRQHHSAPVRKLPAGRIAEVRHRRQPGVVQKARFPEQRLRFPAEPRHLPAIDMIFAVLRTCGW